MFELLRTLLRQGRPTLHMPAADAGLPERFRGRPLLERQDDACDERFADAVRHVPSAMVQRDRHALPVLDVGQCLFAPEEIMEGASCRTAFTRDHRMASRRRDGLVTGDGQVELATALDEKMQKLLGRSLRLRSVVAGSCNGCESELVALGNVVFDMARFGVQFVASPRHADGIVITGAVNVNMSVALQKTYEAVPDPRVVIAVGACAIGGGPFQGSPEIAGGVPPSVPVDLWIPGCPPHPLTVLDGLLRLLGRLDDGRRSRA